MRRLILMRHGEAERPAPGLEDFDRALDGEGRDESRRMGRALARSGLAPDLALISASLRTMETWRGVAEAFKSEVQVLSDKRLYAASAPQIARVVGEASGRAETAMVVGHNPGIHQYAIHLARQAGEHSGPLFEKFPTGSAAVFAIDAEGRPELERLLLAKELKDR